MQRLFKCFGGLLVLHNEMIYLINLTLFMSCRMYKTEYEKCAVAHAHKIFFINPAVLEESELTFYKV